MSDHRRRVPFEVDEVYPISKLFTSPNVTACIDGTLWDTSGQTGLNYSAKS